MKPTEIRNLTEQELVLKEQNMRQELQKVRFKKHVGGLANTATIKKLKKDLARVLTEMNARQQSPKA
ncbi:MAG: 50S ribosomal protein L29 [Deltaproteobacteria bacterium]|nr:50S ribosomal protein L29 [Deltaproteobacteria bacterium]